MPAMRKWLFLLFAGSLLAFVAPGLKQTEAQTTPDHRFGLTEVFWLPEEAVELGVGWERILFYWREIQPEGPDDWNTLHVREEWLVEAESQGREVVGLIKNTAHWASEDGSEAGVPKGLYLPADDPNNLWANYVRRLADYYSQHGVHHWIIWNEPEIDQDVYGFEFAGTVADYYQLLKIAYMVMKERDPQAVIHLAGLTYWHDPAFLERLLEKAASDPEAEAHGYFFDVISLHIYFRTETVKTIIEEVNEVQTRYGLAKPVWINETNAPPNFDPAWPVERPRFNVDLEQQAWFIVQSIALGFASGAERVSVYKLLDIHLPPGGESFGLVRPDYSKRPAYDAYKLATRCFGGFEEVKVDENPLYYRITFEQPGILTHVAWSRTPVESAVRIPMSGGDATLIRLAGEQSEIFVEDGSYTLLLPGQRCDDECLVGGEPIVLMEAIGETSRADSCVNFRDDVPDAAPRGREPGDVDSGTGETESPVETNSGETPVTGSLHNPSTVPSRTGSVTVHDSDTHFGPQPTATFRAGDEGQTNTALTEDEVKTMGQTGMNDVAPAADARSSGDGAAAIGVWFLAAGLGLGGLIVLFRYRTKSG